MFLGIPCQYLLLIFAMALSLFPQTAYAAKKKVKWSVTSGKKNVALSKKKKTPKPTPVVTPTPKPTKKPLQTMQPANQTPATAHPRQGLYAEEEDVQISSVKFDKAVQCYGKYGILHGDRRVLQSG